MATEVTTQLAEHPLSPKAEQKAKKPEHRPRSHENDRPQKEPLVPGIVDFKVIQEALRTPKPQVLGTYRFGHLSHHSFFSRHHPHPQHVTHIQDLTGRPVCVVRDKSSLSPLPQAALLSHCLMGMPTVPAPVGDPRSNRDPRLFSEAWKKELKDLASQVVTFSKENELKNKEQEEPKREQGAKYSAETGRLIPASTRALSRRHSRQGQGSYTSSRDGGVQTYVLQDQELLGGFTLPGNRFSGSLGRVHRAGHQVLHLPPRAQTPANQRHSRHQRHVLGSPRSPFKTEMGLFPMILQWRMQGGKGPEAARMADAEDTAASKAGVLLGGGKEPQAEQLAEPASPHWGHPTSLLTSPDSELGNFRVGRLVGSLKSPHQGFGHLGLDLGAPLSDPANGLLECYPVLAALRSSQGERLGLGAPADSSGSAASPASSLHPNRKTPKPAPGGPGTTSRKAAAVIQPIPKEVKGNSSTRKRKTRAHWKSTSSANTLKSEHRRERAQDRVTRSLPCSARPALKPARTSNLFSPLPPQQRYVLSYHTESIKLGSSL